MTSSLLKILNSLSTKVQPKFIASSRNGHHLRGNPPWKARTIQQRLEELNYKDPELHYKVDIGLPPRKRSRSEQLQNRLNVVREQRKTAELEKLAKNKQLLVDLDACKEEWLHSVGAQHICKIAEHYGVFKHLFGDAYFNPRVPLTILYDLKEVEYPVYYGNTIKPSEAASKPQVKFASDDDSLWTLILTNPDGHFTNQDSEYVHWFVGNIPGNKLEKGEEIVQYLQPFPPKGTGFHRFIFILYKQGKKLDFSTFKKEGACLTLSDRTFSTLDFYKNRQDDITPAGLAFFQSDWDPTLTKFYHNVLNMKEPYFEYDFPPPYIKPQVRFPLKEPFNLYMDKYRDPKQIHKEFLIRKLKNVHPFKAPPPPLPYPNAQYFEGYVPTWLKLEIRKSRLKWGRINDIE